METTYVVGSVLSAFRVFQKCMSCAMRSVSPSKKVHIHLLVRCEKWSYSLAHKSKTVKPGWYQEMKDAIRRNKKPHMAWFRKEAVVHLKRFSLPLMLMEIFLARVVNVEGPGRQRFLEENNCDAVLETEGKKFLVHRNVLCAVSEYFEKLFTIEMSDKYKTSIEIPAVSAEILEIILSFIYTARIKISMDNVFELMEAANYLQVPHIFSFSTDFLVIRKTISNCTKFWKEARRLNANRLEKCSAKFIAANFDLLLEEKSFINLDEVDFKDVILLKSLGLSCEDSVCRAIVAWVKHDLETRKPLFDKFFAMLDLDAVSKCHLSETVAKEELVKQSMESKEKTFEALRIKMSRELERPEKTKSFLVFNKSFTSLRLYDMETHVQEILSRRSEPRYEASSVVLNGFVYLIGGYTECPNVPTRSCLKLSLSNPEEGWKEVASLTHGRRNAKTAVVENFIYAVGGICAPVSGEIESHLTGEMYDSMKNQWSITKFALDGINISAIARDATTNNMLAFGKSSSTMGQQFSSYQRNFALHLINGCQLNGSWTRDGTVTSVVTAQEATYLMQNCSKGRKILKMHEDGAVCHVLFTTNSFKFFDACTVPSSLIVTVKATEGNTSVANHYLGQFDLVKKYWRIIRSIKDLDDFHVLLTIRD